MPVAMRPSENVRYRKHIPKEEFATTPLRCRYYDLTCNRRPLSLMGVQPHVARPDHQATSAERRSAALVRAAVQDRRAVRSHGQRQRGRPISQRTGGRLRHPGTAVRRAGRTGARSIPLPQGANPVRRVLLPLPRGAPAVRLMGSTATGIRNVAGDPADSHGGAENRPLAATSPAGTTRPGPAESGRIRARLARNWRAHLVADETRSHG